MLIYYQNVNRIRSRLDKLHLNSLNCNYDVICLTETNLNSGVLDSEILDNRYNIYRRDRITTTNKKTEGGGVLVAIKKCFTAVRRPAWESDIEDVWISISPTRPTEPTIHISACYLPGYLTHEEVKLYHNNLKNVLLSFDTSHDVVLMGDFNIPELGWNFCPTASYLIPDNPMVAISSKSKYNSDALLETMSLGSLKQYNSIKNQNLRILDLVLSNSLNVSVGTAIPLLNLDRHHPALEVELKVFVQSKQPNRNNHPRYNFNKCDYPHIKHDLSNIDWHLELKQEHDVDTNVNVFYAILNDIIKKHTPLMINKNNSYPVWFSTSLIKCLSEKNKYHKRFKKYGNPRDYDTFAMLRSRCKALLKSCRKSFLSLTEESLKGNPKFFWKYVNARKPFALPQTMSYSSQSASDDKDICELFSQYFSSVFNNTQNNANTELEQPVSSGNLANISVSIQDVKVKLKLLDGSKGAGPDGIPPKFLKACSTELSLPLSLIFNKSLSQGVFPSIWKTAHVIPIYKSGNKNLCENYRPISILNSLAKVFESTIYDHFYFHFKSVISPSQHGFVKNKSTITNLLEYKNYLCNAFAKSEQVDSIYTDFSKAFDKVPHDLLCAKLERYYGIHGNLLRWIQSYLTRRNQVVFIRNSRSSSVTITSGVPQGSHLGPLFFNIFINDLISHLHCHSLLYADDLKIFNLIQDNEDSILLQEDLNRILLWCQNNKMVLNIKKCFIVSFSNKRRKTEFLYKLDGHILERKTIIRDLGVTFDDKLTFRQHIDDISKKAYQLIGFISRSTKGFRKLQSYLSLYNTIVRSVVEYGCIIWSPSYAINSSKLEAVQKKFLKILSFRMGHGRSLGSYTARCKKYAVTTLDVRRKRQDLLWLHKIMHSSTDTPTLLSEIDISTKRLTRSQIPFPLFTYKNNTSYYNPFVRMRRLYNSVSNDLDIFNPKYLVFKNSVTKILQ